MKIATRLLIFATMFSAMSFAQPGSQAGPGIPQPFPTQPPAAVFAA